MPAITPITPLAKPWTATGVLRSVVVPSPSWPRLLYPQHTASPAFMTAQLFLSPTAIDVAPIEMPDTPIGSSCWSWTRRRAGR
jgi:hypothetical protein